MQVEEDKDLSLGMPVQSQEIENDEQPENEEKELPPSPPMDEGNTKFFVDDKLCSYDSDNEEEYQPMPNENIINNDEEYGLDMLYDNALDDCPMLIDNPLCLEVEDKNDIIAACDGTLTHESPTLFLNSPNYTIEEKFAYVEKYLCGLQLPLVPNLCCNHDIKLNTDLINYFERGKHANEFHNKFNNPLYVPKLSKLNDSCGYMVKFISTTCNYYERGGDKNPLYVTNNYMLQVNIVNMH